MAHLESELTDCGRRMGSRGLVGGGGWELGQAVYDFNFNWHPHCLGRP